MISTKGKIIEAAKKLFSKYGYDKVTTRDIAGEAGVALSAITYYFKSKENVLTYLVNQFHSEQKKASFASIADIQVQSTEEFVLRMEIFVETYILSLFKDLPLFLLVTDEFERRNPVLIAMIQDPSKNHALHLVKFIEGAQKNGFIAKDIDALMVSFMFIKEIGITIKMEQLKTWVTKGSLSHTDYRKKWIGNLLRILFHGILLKEKTMLIPSKSKVSTNKKGRRLKK